MNKIITVMCKNKPTQYISNLFLIFRVFFVCLSGTKLSKASSEFKKAYKKSETEDC